jgi:hypothetical protein
MMLSMRTTISIDDDVLEKAKSVADRLHRSFRLIINEALRAGLQTIEEPPISKPYKTCPHKMGLRPGINLDNIQEVISQVEGESCK